MPVDLPPVSRVYQDQLTTLSQGLALWNPNPLKEIYDKVSIGDVGYLHEGSFIRMFNVMLPWSHESNRTLGEPEPYESLDCGPFANTFKRQFDRVKHCSRNVSAETNAVNGQAITPDDVEGVTYKFRNCGALLSVPNGGLHEDVIRAQAFESYIRDHVDRWFTWAQKNRLGVERVDDLILVSGCTLVTSWAAAAFVDDTMDAEISLASRAPNNGRASFVWSNIRGRVLYHNSPLEPISTMTQDQCVFIRGFRVKRLLFGIRPIRIGSGRNDENPQRSPHWRNNSLRSAPSFLGPSSSSDTIGPTINHEDTQLLPYPSSTALQSNGDLCNASFTTSPNDNSLIEFPNDISEIFRLNSGGILDSVPELQHEMEPDAPVPDPMVDGLNYVARTLEETTNPKILYSPGSAPMSLSNLNGESDWVDVGREPPIDFRYSHTPSPSSSPPALPHVLPTPPEIPLPPARASSIFRFVPRPRSDPPEHRSAFPLRERARTDIGPTLVMGSERKRKRKRKNKK